MFGKLARGVTTHPIWVILAWLVAAVAVLALSPQLVHFTSNNNSSFLPSHYESVQAQDGGGQVLPGPGRRHGAPSWSAPTTGGR